MSNQSGTGSGKGGFVPPSTAELDAILETYEFLEILGRGGMGAVYKARQKSLDRLVAIKILPPSLAEEETEDAEDEGVNFHFAERFQREARAMAKLTHPNIIAVYDFGQASDGQFYFVMEYVEGSDLHSLIRTGELTVAHVAGWMSQICEALQYAHGKGIVHRDIKPANIMITREGQVKVADFGLAKITGGDAVETKLTMTNMAMGTPDYVAPEVLEMDVEIDHRADLYAVGVMLYEMLTGKVPRGAWKSPSEVVPGLDARYDKLVEKAMDSDRGSRFQHASEISATIYEIATTVRATSAVETESANRVSRMLTPDSDPPGTSREGPATRSALRTKHKPVQSQRNPVGLVAGIVGGVLLLGLGSWVVLKKDSNPVAVAESPPASPVAQPEKVSQPVAGELSPLPPPPTDITLAPKASNVVHATPPPSPSVRPRRKAPDEDPSMRITNTLNRLLDGITEIDFGDRVPGLIEVTGTDAMPLLAAPDGRVFGVSVAPQDESLPRVVALTHGSFLQGLGHLPDNRRLFENAVVWMAGEGKPALLISPDELSWGGKQWAVQNGYRVDSRPPEGGGGVLVLAENSAYESEENRKLIQELLPKVDGVFTALTPWANIDQRAFPQHPAGEIFAPFGFKFVYGYVGVIGKWERRAEMPTEDPTEENWIDLLTLVDGERDSLMGPWTLEDGLLRSPANPNESSPSGHTTLAMAPPIPTDHYDLRWRISRDVRGHVIVIPFSARGKNHFVAFDQRSREGSSVVLPGAKDTVIARDSDFFEVGVTQEVMLFVRGDVVRVSYDGETLLEERADGGGLRDTHFFPGEKITTPILGVGVCDGRITIHEASFRVVEGAPDLTANTSPNGMETNSSANADDLLTKIAAAGVSDPRIAQLEQGFQAAYERDANSHFKSDLATLDQGYLGALDRARTAVQRAGDLTAVTQLDEEKERIAGGSGVPPTVEDTGDPAPLAVLRTTYREAHQKLERERSSRAAPLTEKYLSALVAYESELTRGNEIEKALAVREFRDLVATRGEEWIPEESKPPASAPEASGPPPADLRDLPRGRAKAYGVGAGGEPLPVDAREHLVYFADHRDLVRVFAVPHWPHALKANGELMGYLAPPEAENRRIVAVSLGYFCAMSLRADGTVVVPHHQSKAEPPGLPLASIGDAVSVASNSRAAAILRASGELVVWADASGSPARIELEDPPKDLVSLHPAGSVLLARDKSGEFHAIHPAGNRTAASELNAVGGIALLEASPHADHWLALDEKGKVHAGPGRDPWTEVPDDLGKVTALRVGSRLSAARLESGEWRAWGNAAGGVVEKIHALGPKVHDLSMDSFDEEKTKLLWLE